MKKIGLHKEHIKNIYNKYPNIEDRTIYDVFTIDPHGSRDFDDAYSIRMEDDTYILSIYISNVTMWLDYLDLWESFSQRVSTIYLPNIVIPMLPSILSEKLCSLVENKPSFAFTMNITIDKNYMIQDIKFSNTMIYVVRNYIYEEEDLFFDSSYKMLKNVCESMLFNYKYMEKINDSHDVISFIMLLMNHNVAKEMVKYKNGIFRSNKILEGSAKIPSNISYHGSICKYVDGSTEELSHDMLGLECYLHITSPIRRLVDLLNIIQFQINTNMIKLSNKANDFYTKWINKLDHINIMMKNIRRVQSDCMLLHLCTNNIDMIDKIYDGHIIDKNIKKDIYEYTVYLPELKITSSIISNEQIDMYKLCRFKLYLFKNEYKLKSKIRLMVLC